MVAEDEHDERQGMLPQPQPQPEPEPELQGTPLRRDVAPTTPNAATARGATASLLDQLSAANSALAAQNTVYRAEKSPWRAAQAATRLSAVSSPPPPPLLMAAAAGAFASTKRGPAPTRAVSPPPPEGMPVDLRQQIAAAGSKLAAKPSDAETSALRLFVVVEQAEKLPVMDLLSSDPYLKVWHQESTPPQQPDSHSDVASESGRLPCMSTSTPPPVAFKSASLTHLGQSSYLRENLDPIWHFAVEHEITLRPGQTHQDKGWLVVEVWDYDRVGDDDPMGRIDIALEECEEDVVLEKWYKLGWVPGQTHPGPGESSRVKVRLLLSSLPDGLPKDFQWMLKSYDFVELQELITAHEHEHEAAAESLQEDESDEYEQLDEDDKSKAVMARCEWHLYETINEAFITFDVDGDGRIQPAELLHVMGVLGEDMEYDELAGMIAEAKNWAQPQPQREALEYPDDTHTCTFQPETVASLDFTKGQEEACITAEEFRTMLTQYWVSRKYGSSTYGAVNSVKFRRINKYGLKKAGFDAPVVHYAGLTQALDNASSNMPPIPGWMADIAAGHHRMSDDKRVPEMFWFFLRRKMEQVLLRANKTGVKEIGFFKRELNGDVSDKSSLGYTIRDTDSNFSAYWDLMQVVMLAYVVVAVPYQTGFDVGAELGSGLWWWELFVDSYFVVDIILNFRTPFYDGQGRLIFSTQAMAKNYLKGWLLIDIGSCASLLQYWFLITDSGDSDGASKARLTKVLRLLRLAKLLRLARLKRILDRLSDEIITILAPLGNVFVLLLGTFMCMHLIACFWYLAGSSSDFVNGKENTGWVAEVFDDPLNVTIGTRYLASLYGIMLGEFTLQPTDSEKSFALVSVIMNGFIYGAVAATLSSIMVMLKAPHAEYNAKMDVLKTWMRAKKLPFSIREQVEIFYASKLSGSERKVVDQAVIIADLQPAPIATELVQILYSDIIERVPIFSRLNDEVIVKLCMLLQPIPALSGNPVIVQGRQGNEMYIVLRGRLQVWEQTDKALTRVKCAVNGISFWSTVYLGLGADERLSKGSVVTEPEEIDDDEDRRRQERASKGPRRHGLSLDNPTILLIQELHKDASSLSEEGYKKMQVNDFTCIVNFQDAKQKLGTAESMVSALGGDQLVRTQVDSVQLGLQVEHRLQQALRAHRQHQELSKFDREERESHPTGAIDLRGKEGVKGLAHRALSLGGKSIVQGVVRVESPTLYRDFDPALGRVAKPPRLRLHQTVDVLEVRHGNVLGYLTDGDYFGEASLASRDNSRYDRNVTAVADTELCYLRKSDVADVAKEFPELKYQINSFAKLRKSLEEPRRKFNSIDTDSSGSLDHEELGGLLRDLKVGRLSEKTAGEEEIAEAINEMDWSGDGDVSFEEFEAWWIRRQERASIEESDGNGKHKAEEEDEDLEYLEGDEAALEDRLTARIDGVTSHLDFKIDRVEDKVDRLEEAVGSLHTKLDQLLDQLSRSE